MDFLTLDTSLRRIAIFDTFTSLVWNERYSSAGDFQLEILSSRATRSALSVGTLCTVTDTPRVAKIETVEDVVTSDGTRLLKISGRGIEATVLGDRIGAPNYTNLTVTPKWTVTGLPAAIARKIFNDICVSKINSAYDGIPFYKAGSIFTKGTLPEPIVSVTMELDLASVYEQLVRVCSMYNLGFRLARNGDKSELYFDVYTGDNRTSLQSTFPAVVFSTELDNLSSTSELTSTAVYKNVAIVMSAHGATTVYAEGWDVNSAVGFDRRLLLVKADDIDLTDGAALTVALVQRGKEALSEHKVVIAFDGEIPQFGSYAFGPGKDYDLGDLIEVRNADGLATNMRVDEFIRTSDSTGEKAYPTLVSEQLITPGSWLSFGATGYWADAVGYWADV